MTGLASRVSAICFSSASSGVPSTSSTKCLPWRTLRTPSWPSRPSAPSTACPWGSEISGFRTTSTTTRDTARGYLRPAFLFSLGESTPSATDSWRSAPDAHEFVALEPSREAESSPQGGQHDRRAAEHVCGREPQDAPIGQHDAVLPAQVLDEHAPVPVDVPVELDHDSV